MERGRERVRLDVGISWRDGGRGGCPWVVGEADDRAECGGGTSRVEMSAGEGFEPDFVRVGEGWECS